MLDPSPLFTSEATPGPDRIWLEIGFGAGEHLLDQAEAHPDVGFIGCEPFLSGVASTLAEIERRDLRNIRIAVDDARLLLRALPERSLERIFVLFPDPWPKARHRKRRIVNPATLAEMARLLVPGGELRLASDDPDYVRAMLLVVHAQGSFTWMAGSAADWRERPLDWPATRYERKALAAGRRPVFLRFRRSGI